MQCASSVASVLRNLRRAGVAKNSSRTSTLVPVARAAGVSSPERASRRCACGASAVRLAMAISATEAMAASASPRKPIVATCSRSCSEAILLVAWRRSASGNSAAGMPMPSSSTRMARMPPPVRRTTTSVAPASTHVEAGLRSFNKYMPEELNRVLTDHVSSLLFCPSQTAVQNLEREGFRRVAYGGNLLPSDPAALPEGSLWVYRDSPLVVNVGNLMFDLLLHTLGMVQENAAILNRLNLTPKSIIRRNEYLQTRSSGLFHDSFRSTIY